MLLLEAAGFDVILVETVGVGQSEVTVRSMVDHFLLLLVAGAGDELQGIKRGVVELADSIVVHKADGDNMERANAARGEYERAIHYLTPVTEGWTPKVVTASSTTGDGIDELWSLVETFRDKTTESGVFERRRREQAREWVHAIVRESLLARFNNSEQVQAIIAELESAVMHGRLPATTAAQRLLDAFFSRHP